MQSSGYKEYKSVKSISIVHENVIILCTNLFCIQIPKSITVLGDIPISKVGWYFMKKNFYACATLALIRRTNF